MAQQPVDKDALIQMLHDASELEHSLCCQYLYAAFSLKAGGDPGLTAAQAELVDQWQRQLTKIAVQEMYHLMLASNLLIAVGSAPHFTRPNFPQLKPVYSEIDLPLLLTPFDRETAARFVCWEKPEAPPDGWWVKWCQALPDESERVTRLALTDDEPPYSTIGELYHLIESALQQNSGWIDPNSKDKQVTSRYVPFSPKVAPITSPADSSRYIEIIVTEGEGAPNWQSTSHFAYFHQITDQFDQIAAGGDTFAAAWSTVDNPVYSGSPPGGSPIGDSGAREVGAVFNQAYLLLLVALSRLFEPQTESDAERQALANAALALMPLAIKPLGVLLTRMPAGTKYPGMYAGPSFELPATIPSLPPAPKDAWAALAELMERLVAQTRAVALFSEVLSPAAEAQLARVMASLETLEPLFDIGAVPAR